MKKKLFVLTLFILVEGAVGYPFAFSQETSGKEAWTLEKCIQAALKNRPELQFSTLDFRSSRLPSLPT